MDKSKETSVWKLFWMLKAEEVGEILKFCILPLVIIGGVLVLILFAFSWLMATNIPWVVFCIFFIAHFLMRLIICTFFVVLPVCCFVNWIHENIQKAKKISKFNKEVLDID